MIRMREFSCAMIFVFALTFAASAHHHDTNVVDRATNVAELHDDGGDIEEFGGASVAVPMRDASQEEAVAQIAIQLAQAETPAQETSAPTVTSAGTDETPAVEEKEKRGIDFGGRLALGNAYTVGADLRLPISETWRFNVGLDAGYAFGKEGYHAWSAEFKGFIEQKNNISKEGDFRWFWGPGIALGWQGVSGEEKVFGRGPVTPEGNETWDKADTLPTGFPRLHDDKNSNNSSNIGLGVQFGLETVLTFIDPEHSLYRLRDATVSVDFRLMYYPWDGQEDSLEKFPSFVWGIGLSFRWTY